MSALSRAATEPPAAPEERGTLTIGHLVVRKIAQRAADEVSGTARAERRVAGVTLGEQGTSARVSGRDNDVDLALQLALHYPASVRAVVGDVREAVTARVQHLTSYRVRSLAVTVSALQPDVPPRVR